MRAAATALPIFRRVASRVRPVRELSAGCGIALGCHRDASADDKTSLIVLETAHVVLSAAKDPSRPRRPAGSFAAIRKTGCARDDKFLRNTRRSRRRFLLAFFAYFAVKLSVLSDVCYAPAWRAWSG